MHERSNADHEWTRVLTQIFEPRLLPPSNKSDVKDGSVIS